MGRLPSGTVTMLFSDMEGSTALLNRLGPAYVDALDGQRLVLRRAWTAHHGTEMGTEGDSFFVVFQSAPEAVAAAAQAQRELSSYAWPAGEQVRVRMGIHTGAPVIHDGGYVGLDVHRAARIAGSAHGGQVVLSAATASLAADHLPEATRLDDLGTHQLKDIPSAEHLHQLTLDGLLTEFPPLKTLGAPSRLPEPATRLVGREEEVSELATLLGSPGVRLVTLTGPGGSGKTRLAIAIAQRLAPTVPDGVYFVPLVSDTTVDAAWVTISETLGLPPEQRTAGGVTARLSGQRVLLVLDNLEQLFGADELVGQLLAAATQSLVVASSRSPLHLLGEHEHPVPPLALPTDDALEAVHASAAVELFVQQARRVRPDFAVTEDNAGDVVAVCRRLDGLPLALELAAARVKFLSAKALLRRLDVALDIAAASTQTPPRHRTLRATLTWSYDLLTPDLQQVFRRLGVFSGGAELDAIDAVVRDDDRTGLDSLDVVAELVDAGLVRIAEGIGAEPRVELLETIRAYAADLLTEHGEADHIRERHARHYLRVAEAASPMFRDDRYWTARSSCEAESDNFRQALDWTLPADEGSVAPDRSELGSRLCAAVGDFWAANAYVTLDSAIWLDRAIDRAGPHDSPATARNLLHRASIFEHGGDADPARTSARSGLMMARRLGDSLILMAALHIMATLEGHSGELEEARTLYEEALTISRKSGDLRQRHSAVSELAIFLLATERRDLEGALALMREALAIAREIGSPPAMVFDQQNIACNLLMLKRIHEARELMQQLVPEALDLDMAANLMYLAEDYAAILAEAGQAGSAATLLGAANAMHERSGLVRPPEQEAEIEGSLAQARAVLGEQEWQAAYGTGQDLPIADALRRAHAADLASSA